jgi:SAM-dependent methyltransferase
MTGVSWQKLKAARDRAAERWPSPFALPLVKRPSDVLYAALAGKERVLDVGAGDATRKRRIAARFAGVEYVSVDPDVEAKADFVRLEDAPGAFDAALLFETLEHLRPDDGIALLELVRGRLAPGGRVFVSVPAIHTPGRFQRDCTHVTPWAHDELGGALILAGLTPTAMHRTYPGPALRRTLRRVVLGPVGHAFGIDYAYSVVVTGICGASSPQRR